MISSIPRHKYICDGKLFVFVDAFNESNKLPASFFDENDVLHVLTHAHADHYTGLRHASWLSSPAPGRRKVLCSELTARLVHAIVGVHTDNFQVLPVRTPVSIHANLTVTLVDANHCPGAVMALFEFQASGRRVLHTGDFRFSPQFKSDARFAPLQALTANCLESIYLDTTYCHPRHKSIPSRDEALEEIGREVGKRMDNKTLHLVSTYTIGKERVLEEVSQRVGQRIFVDDRKYELLGLSERNMEMYTTDPGMASSSVRAVTWGMLGDTFPYFRPNFRAPAELARDLGYSRVVGWVSTGWVGASQQRSFMKRNEEFSIDVEIVLVPYSEHSSFSELQEFVSWLRPQNVVPTVGASDEKAASKLQAYFRHSVDAKANKAAFISKMRKRSRDNDETQGHAEELKLERQEQDDVIVLIDDNDDDDDGGMEADDVVILSESPGKSAGAPKQIRNQASIKKYFFTHPLPEESDTRVVGQHVASKASEGKQALVPEITSSIPLPISPQKGSNIVVTGRAAVDKDCQEYDPIKDAGFHGSAPYLFLAQAMEFMEKNTSRLAKDRILVNVFRTLLAMSPGDIVPAVYMILGRIADEQDGLELNIGGSTLVRCLSDALGVSTDRLKAKYREVGDMGTVAASSKGSQTFLVAPRPRSVQAIFDAYVQIAKCSGKGSLVAKRQQVGKILRGCTTSAETKFCVRALLSTMRIGANWRSVIPAVGKAHVWHSLKVPGQVPSDEALSEAASRMLGNYCRCPSVSRCCNAKISENGIEILQLELGTPFKPMLARPAGKGVADAVRAIAKSFDSTAGVLCEFKYDGMRALIHANVQERAVRIFSRNGEDRTATFAELPEKVLDAISAGVTNIILDAEVCAITPDGAIDSFQKLSARATNGCSLCLLLFDLLHVSGVSLLDLSLAERRKRLAKVINPNPSVAFAKGEEFVLLDLTPERLREALVAALAQKAEGLMIKDLSSSYECMQRSASWLKLKKDYCEDDKEMGDTFDVRPIGAWWGNGRKAGWFSPFLVAVFDDETETWQSLCRVLSGFSNEFYIEATKRLKEKVVDAKPYEYDTGEHPALWFDTDEVWEIRGADLQLSPVHRAGAGTVDASRGLGLRFPRFVSIRTDKDLEDATTAGDVVALYQS